MHELNSTWLESFRILCEERSFTRAAARLNMTQPGMSQHIAKLEERLGTRLVERDAPGFMLTEAGDKTLALARSRWREERDFLARLEDVDADSGKVALACSGSFAMLVYPRLIGWMTSAPGLTVVLDAAPEDRIVEGVLSGAFDIGVVSGEPRHPRLTLERLGDEHLDLILSQDWAGRSPTLQGLQALGFIQHPDGARYADRVLGANFADDYPGAEGLRIRSTVNQIGQIPAPVAAGLGYTVLPRSGVLAFPGRDRLAIAELPQPSMLELRLIELRGKSRSKRIEKLVDLVRREAAKLD